ncbi:MAG: type II toxin-antitoxin system RelE/ParE family toxin [Candidatus Woesearchaeota archaeon]
MIKVYTEEIKFSCKKTIRKACKKNPVLRKVLESKMQEIILFPARYKPLKYELAGERSVHILKSFVLKFEIDEAGRTVTFISFKHHDKAYKR